VGMAKRHMDDLEGLSLVFTKKIKIKETIS